jgi:hypothetical protein
MLLRDARANSESRDMPDDAGEPETARSSPMIRFDFSPPRLQERRGDAPGARSEPLGR